MSRTVSIFSLGLLGLCGLSGCQEQDPAALFLDFSYQLRCIDCEPRVADSPVRDLALVDGEQDTVLTCSASPSGDTNLLNLSVESGDHSFELKQVRLGSDPGDPCRVEVKEGEGQTYSGTCKSEGSDGAAPCEVELNKEGGKIVGTIHCTRIKHTLTPTYTRHLVAPGTTDEAAEISIEGCAGF